MLDAVNFPDDGSHPSNAYFGIGFSKTDRHVRYLPSAATKSLILELKVKSLKHMCFPEIIFS